MTAPVLPEWPSPDSDEGEPFFANARTVIQTLADLGWPRPAALAALARAELESSLIPHIVGDLHMAHGLWQWHPDRLADILAHTGIDIGSGHASVADQCHALDWELSAHPYLGRADIFGASTERGAGIVFCVLYEGAGAPNAAVKTGMAAVRWSQSGLV